MHQSLARPWHLDRLHHARALRDMLREVDASEDEKLLTASTS
jgi:hypothetical protein